MFTCCINYQYVNWNKTNKSQNKYNLFRRKEIILAEAALLPHVANAILQLVIIISSSAADRKFQHISLCSGAVGSIIETNSRTHFLTVSHTIFMIQ